MVTDSGTTTADAPPPPPPPPPPAESSNQRIADIGSSRTGDGDHRSEPQGLETPGLRPTPEFQQQLDTFRESRDAARQSDLTPQQSADLGSSRTDGGNPPADQHASEPAEPSLRPTPEVQQLDMFRENKDAARQPELTPEQTAELGSSRGKQAPHEQIGVRPEHGHDTPPPSQVAVPELSTNPLPTSGETQQSSRETPDAPVEDVSSAPEPTSAENPGHTPHTGDEDGSWDGTLPKVPEPRDDVEMVERDDQGQSEHSPELDRNVGDAGGDELAAAADDVQHRDIGDGVTRLDTGREEDNQPGGDDDQHSSHEHIDDVEPSNARSDTAADNPGTELDETGAGGGDAGGGPPEPPGHDDGTGRPPPPDAEGYLGHAFEANTIQVGDVLDRYGNEGGRWLSPTGTSVEDRALPQGHSNDLNSYLVVRELPADVTQGVTATYLEPGGGGGIQYVLPEGRTVQDYIKEGYLVRLNP